jgi:hypothetical protein
MALDWKKFIYFMAIWNILWRVGIFYDHFGTFCIHLGHLSGFGTMYQEKSGNPALASTRQWRQNSNYSAATQRFARGRSRAPFSKSKFSFRIKILIRRKIDFDDWIASVRFRVAGEPLL